MTEILQKWIDDLKDKVDSARDLVRITFSIGKEKYDLDFMWHKKIAGRFDRPDPEDCVYNAGGRRFKGEEAVEGDVVEEFGDSAIGWSALKQNRFGDKFLYQYISVPTFDSGDREWDSGRYYALLFDGKKIDAVFVSGGYRIASIEIFYGLRRAPAAFRAYLEKMDCTKDVLDKISWV